MANDFDLALRLQVRSYRAAAPHGSCLAEPNVPQREFDEERGEEQRRMREVRVMRMQLRPCRCIIRRLGPMIRCQYTSHAAWLAAQRDVCHVSSAMVVLVCHVASCRQDEELARRLATEFACGSTQRNEQASASEWR